MGNYGSKEVRDPALGPHIGYVYFIYCPANNRVRIGYSDRNPDRRFVLTDVYCPEFIEKLALMRGAYSHEQHVHSLFREHKFKGEWFNMHDSIREYIRDHARPWEELLEEECVSVARGIYSKLSFFGGDGSMDGKFERESYPRKPGRKPAPKPPTAEKVKRPKPKRYGPLQALLDHVAAAGKAVDNKPPEPT